MHWKAGVARDFVEALSALHRLLHYVTIVVQVVGYRNERKILNEIKNFKNRGKFLYVRKFTICDLFTALGLIVKFVVCKNGA